MPKLLSFFIILLFIGCQDKDVAPKGSIVGFVKLYDETGTELTDKSGVKVSLDGNQSTTTDAIGRYQFDGIESGTFQVLFEKSGYGTVKKFNTQYAAGGEPGFISTINMIATPAYQITNGALSLPNTTTLRFTGTITETKQYYFIVYFSNKEDVSDTNYVSSGGFIYSGPTVVTTFSVNFSNVPTTTPLYATVYGATYMSNTSPYVYYNPELAANIYPASRQIMTPVKLR